MLVPFCLLFTRWRSVLSVLGALPAFPMIPAEGALIRNLRLSAEGRQLPVFASGNRESRGKPKITLWISLVAAAVCSAVK